MSGSIFGQVPQIAVPDFGATAARAQGMQANRLAMMLQQRQMDEADQRQQFFAQNAQGFASPDAGKRMNLLAMLAQQPGGAGMALPMIQQARNQQMLQSALTGEGPAPATAPAGGMAQPVSGGGGYLDTLIRDESGGDATARNPRSSATGAAQFIDSTWMQFARANPQLFQGMNQQQILAARNDPALSRQAAEWYRRENLTALSDQGLPANDGTAALAHRFGPGDAARLLRADQSAPIASVVSPQVMAANPDLNGRTVGQVVTRYGQRFGGGDNIPAQGAPRPGAVENVPTRGSGNANAAVVQRLLAVGTPEAMQMAQIMSQIGQRAAPTEREALFQRWRELQANPNPTPSQAEEATILRAYLGGERTIERGPNSFDSERGTTLAKEEAATRRLGRESGRTLSRLGQIERDLERFQTGATSGARITVGQIAQTLGIPDSMLPPGFRRDEVASGETIRSQAMGLIQSMLGSGEFPTNNFSNADMMALQQANPSLANSPAGNRAIMGVMRAMAQRNLEVAREWDAWRRQNGSGMDSYDRFNLERLPEITSRDILAPIMQDAFPANAGDPAPPRGGQVNPAAGPAQTGIVADPPPPAQAPPRVGETRRGYIFRGGNPADQSSWEAVR